MISKESTSKLRRTVKLLVPTFITLRLVEIPRISRQAWSTHYSSFRFQQFLNETQTFTLADASDDSKAEPGEYVTKAVESSTELRRSEQVPDEASCRLGAGEAR